MPEEQQGWSPHRNCESPLSYVPAITTQLGSQEMQFLPPPGTTDPPPRSFSPRISHQEVCSSPRQEGKEKTPVGEGDEKLLHWGLKDSILPSTKVPRENRWGTWVVVLLSTCHQGLCLGAQELHYWGKRKSKRARKQKGGLFILPF